MVIGFGIIKPFAGSKSLLVFIGFGLIQLFAGSTSLLRPDPTFEGTSQPGKPCPVGQVSNYIIDCTIGKVGKSEWDAFNGA